MAFCFMFYLFQTTVAIMKPYLSSTETVSDFFCPMRFVGFDNTASLSDIFIIKKCSEIFSSIQRDLSVSLSNSWLPNQIDYYGIFVDQFGCCSSGSTFKFLPCFMQTIQKYFWDSHYLVSVATWYDLTFPFLHRYIAFSALFQEVLI